MKKCFLILIFIISGCSSKQYSTYNNSYYTFKIFKTKTSIDKTVVKMNFNYVNKSMRNNPCWIDIGSKKYETSSDNLTVNYNIVKEIPIRLNIASLGCFSIETKPIFFKKNDSIVFNFHFAEMDKPLN